MRSTALLAILLATTPLTALASAPAVAPRCDASISTTLNLATSAPVPDNGFYLYRDFTVSGLTGVVWDIDIVVNVTHPNPGDLSFELVGPDSTVVTLSARRGGTADNVFAGTRFDDQGGRPITDISFANNVAVPLAAPEEALAKFRGVPANGVWQLAIRDYVAGNAGTFVSASLVITTVPTLPNQVTRNVSRNVSQPIPDQFVVDSPVLVQGAGTFVSGVRVFTYVTHTANQNLDITLTSPAGTVVTLSSGNGGSFDNGFNGTEFRDDAGARVASYTFTNGVAAPTVSPEEPLAALIGEAANGTWTLSVGDGGPGDVGTLAGWSLYVTTASCSRVPAAPPGFAAPVTTTVSDVRSVAVPPAGTVGTTTVSMPVQGAGPYLWDVDVITRLDHPKATQLKMSLQSPRGTVVPLTAYGLGGPGPNLDGTRWDDQADLPISRAYPGDLGPYRAVVPVGALGALIGENPNGTWTLVIEDIESIDSGVLDGWTLEISTLAAPPVRASHTRTSSASAAIPDGGGTALVQSLAVSGLPRHLANVRLLTTIAHPQPADLLLVLRSPAGTTVTLSSGNGSNAVNAFNGITWSDAAGLTPITSVYPFPPGPYPAAVPEEAMSAFIGEDPNGTWQLTVIDSIPAAAGTLSNWSLLLETAGAFDLRQTLSVTPGGVAAGGALTYTAQTTNAGPGEAPAPVVLTLPLPTGTRFVSATAPAGWSCTTPSVGSSGTVRCTRATAMASAATATLVVNATVAPATPAQTSLAATATAQAASTDSNSGNDAATATALVVAPTTSDTDGDGLPDAWETQFGLNPSSAGGSNGPLADPDGDGRNNAQELADGTHPRGFHTRYFAEGATSAFFDTRFALLNPNGAPALTLLRFLRAGAPVVAHSLTVGATARGTVVAKTVAGIATAEFSTVVESDQPLVIDRTMTWDGNGYGSHAESSVEAPSTRWYLAEGATHSGFQLFYLLQNANDSAATVTVEYLRPSGAPVVRSYSVPANSRETVWVNTDAALGSTDVSASIASTLPIIVERAMYLNRPGQTFAAGHGSAAVTAPNTSWFLAEGATGPYFDLFVLIANPSNTVANITARFLKPDGTTISRPYSVAAKSRFNIWVDQESLELANTAVSTTILSDVPVLVERAMWWPGDGSTWQEAHNTFGATRTGTKWALADGEHGGVRGVETYVLVANTSSFDGSVRVTLHKEDGSTLVKTFPIKANSRLNVPAGAAEADGGFGPANVDGLRFGFVVESLVPPGGTAAAQIVVERAMYSNAGGTTWAAGTNALATRLQ